MENLTKNQMDIPSNHQKGSELFAIFWKWIRCIWKWISYSNITFLTLKMLINFEFALCPFNIPQKFQKLIKNIQHHTVYGWFPKNRCFMIVVVECNNFKIEYILKGTPTADEYRNQSVNHWQYNFMYILLNIIYSFDSLP